MGGPQRDERQQGSVGQHRILDESVERSFRTLRVSSDKLGLRLSDLLMDVEEYQGRDRDTSRKSYNFCLHL